jgi:hypothetical protein
MQANNLGEEHLGDHFDRVWMRRREEVAVFGELVYNGEDDGFPANLWEPLDEVECDVSPNCTGNRQG